MTDIHADNGAEQRRVGFSPVWDGDAFKSALDKARRGALKRWLIKTLIPVALGTLSGLILSIQGAMDFESGVVFGLFFAVLLQVWVLPPLITATRRVWEGDIIKTSCFHVPRGMLSRMRPMSRAIDAADSRSPYFTDYEVRCRTQDGHKRLMTFREDPDRYGMLRVGDRIRCCPALNSFEKYDRTGDDKYCCIICGHLNYDPGEICSYCGTKLN